MIDEPGSRNKSGRFRPGHSGNLNGRPRKDRVVDDTVGSRLAKALNQRVDVTEQGKRRKISKLDATLKQIVNKGATGDLSNAKLALLLATKTEDQLSRAPRKAA